MPRRAALIALTVMAAPFQAQAATIDENTTYFSVRGSTLEELDSELMRRGPIVGEAGGRHPGATRVSFGGHVTYAEDGRTCRVDETHLTLQLDVTLPRWQSSRGASSETALIWRTLSQDIERHERQHAEIAKSWLRRMEGALRNLRPQHDCAAMEAAVTATTRRYLQGHERAQLDFDIVEGREVGYRLRRALRANQRAETVPPAQP